jgi:hypothetical protein
MINEFDEIDEFDDEGPMQKFREGEDVIEFYDMEDFNVDDDLVTMMGYFFVVFLCTLVTMIVKYRMTVPNLSQGTNSVSDEKQRLNA